MRLLVIDNYDGYGSSNFALSLFLKAVRRAVLFLCKRMLRAAKAEYVVLGPESFRGEIAPLCEAYHSYSSENIFTPWRKLRDEALPVWNAVDAKLADLWRSDEELRAWKAIRPWFIQKWVYLRCAPAYMSLRVIENYKCDANEVRAPLKSMFERISLYFECKERINSWRLQTSLVGTQAPPSHQADALLLSSGVYSPRVLLPLVQSMNKSGIKYEIVTASSDQPWPYDPTQDVSNVNWSYFFSHADRASLSGFEIDAGARAEQILSVFAKDPSLKEVLSIFLKGDWVQAMCMGQVAVNILERYRPKVVVCTKHVRTLEGAMVEAAKSKNLPVIFIDQQLVPQAVEHVDLDSSHHVVVVGPKAKDGFLAIGANENQIHLFGDTRFDVENPSKAPAAHGFKGGRFSVLGVGEIVSEYTLEAELKLYYQALAHVVRNMAQAEVLLKLHPKQSVDGYRRQAQKWDLSRVPWIKKANTYLLIRQADVVVAHVSQAIMEALHMEKPVIVYLEDMEEEKMKSMRQLYPVLSEKFVVLVRSKEELLKQLQRINGDALYRAELGARARLFKQEYYSSGDKTASQLTVDLIASLVRSKVAA